jgi:ribosomal protein S18 acetylase RimI-like enzyme
VYTIRPCTPAEADDLAAVIRAAFEEYRAVLVPTSGAHRESGETVAAKMAHGGAFAAVDAATGALIGCALFSEEPDHIYLGRLSVLPPYRGQGIAHALIAAVEGHGRVRGYHAAQVGVRLQLTANRALFERLGYVETEIRLQEGWPEPTWAVLVKPL